MINSLAKYLVVGGGSLALLSVIVSSNARVSPYNHAFTSSQESSSFAPDTPKQEKPNLKYNFSENPSDNPIENTNEGGLLLKEPSNVETNVEYDPVSGKYLVTKKMGGIDYSPPTYMTSDEYQNYMFRKQVKDYWNARTHADSKSPVVANPALPKLKVGGEVFDRIFGGNNVSIQPNGSAELILGYTSTKTENPAIPERNRKIGSMNFDEKIQLNVIGKIGDKLKISTSYNTEATFDFENQMKLDYTGYDDEILRKIEAGNVSFPLNSSLISGSQTLFGVKTQLQFGRLSVTSVMSQEKGKTSEVEVAGGAQTSTFDISADNYDANRHYFLSHYFRDKYNMAMAGLPFINSQVNITRIEVWVTNVNTATNDIRGVLGLAELGEDIAHIPTNQQGFIEDKSPLPMAFNGQNNLDTLLKSNPNTRQASTAINAINSLSGNSMKQQTNYELIASARKLSSSEYSFHPLLGYLSLKQQLNPSQALCVAYQYTLDGKTYQVGEFSDGGISAPQLLYTKMLKSTTTNPKHPMWDLMMKNIYAIGAYQIKQQDFRLDVFYMNRQTGTDINYLPVSSCQTNINGKPLIQVLNVDRLNQQNDVMADGSFDYIEGVTVISNNGLIIFPVLEPFGEHLKNKFTNGCSDTEADAYAFPQLYDSTKVIAQQYFPQLNRFKLKGKYQSSSSSEINLGSPNIAKNSVVVTAGGVTLTENVDYTVDYTLGRVKILNEGILNSGTPVKVKSGSNALFAMQRKQLLASRFDYKVNRDFVIGGTIMNLTEKPINNKVNIGYEPVSNTILGVDANYKTEAPFLTRMVDKLPFYSTKAPSFLTASGEFAYLIPGFNKAIGKTGNSYVDDFEATQSTIDLKSQTAWVLASTPQGQPNLFPEGGLNNNLANGFNRSKLAWYSISSELLRKTANTTPSNITDEDLSNHFVREILETEVFPSKQLPNGTPNNIAVLDLAYYPNEVGPRYNFDANPSNFSAGLNADGTLKKPESRWGGIMRDLPTTDFQATNVEYIQFWVMDPFNQDNPQSNWNSSGELYFNLGNISEDILNDGQRISENGLPTPVTAGTTIPTVWGQAPSVQPLLRAFNTNPTERPYQDVGYDGLANSLALNGGPTEQTHYNNYLNEVKNIVSGAVYAAFANDPAHDDFHYFRGTDYDNQNLKILERYKNFNGIENNSRTTEQSVESYPTAATQNPNTEDLDRDNNLNTAENYYQYHISLKPADFAAGVGHNYITSVLSVDGSNIKDQTTKPIKWYQFKIPVKNPEKTIGGIDNFQSIRFMRMFIKGSDKPIVLRFARLELVRSEWRKYDTDLKAPGLYQPNDINQTLFDVGAVNLEENGKRNPVNYVLPPNITRQVAYGTTNTIQLNEQALALNVCNLNDGDSRAAFKNMSLDVRNYKKLEMFIHGEAPTNSSLQLKDDDLTIFVRLGTDYIDNYYEYEIPLKITSPGFYNGENINDQYSVWPEANNMVLEFEKLLNAKQQRNLLLGNTSNQEYITYDGTRKITIKGNPNLSAVKTVMIGVRNPRKKAGNETDDGLAKCAQVWINELRLTDFINNGGGAANGNVSAQLADLGTVAVSGSMYTPGFGSIDNKVSERKREDFRQYNLTSSIELGKFLPTAANIAIPMYVGYSETFITPQYDPLAPDLILKKELKTLPKEKQDELKYIVVDYTERKNIAFSNVRKSKGKNATKQHIYDIENWSASYAFNRVVKRSINTDFDTTKNYKGGLTYAYSPTPKNIRPFAKTKFLQKKQLQLIRDVNFYLYPNQLGFSTDVIRDFNKNKYRDVTAGGELLINPTFNKKITWNRNYSLGYAITKDFKIDFNAMNEARVMEPNGDIDTKEKKDTILNNFKNLGKTTQYNSQLNANYNIPVNKLPYLDFTKASVKYSGSYNWKRAPFNADSLGNTIQNSQVISWNGDINFNSLYNKSPYLRKVMSRGMKAPAPKTPKDTTKKSKKAPSAALDYFMKLLISPRNLNATYSINNGTILPGYKQSTQLMGMDSNFEGPTTGFIFGSQKDIRQSAITNDWLVKTPSLNTPYSTTHGTTLNLRSNLEPFPNCRIELTGMQSKTKSHNEFFRWNIDSNKFVSQSSIETGNFSVSFLSVNTSFANGEKTFKTFLEEREKISARLGEVNPNSQSSVNGYSEGYNQTSQDVLIPSFIAAYSGKSTDKVGLTEFPKIPKPNWRVTYDGLSKIPKVKKYFKTVTLTHGYKSTYSVGGYTSNLLYVPDPNGNALAKQTETSIAGNPNFYAQNLITTISIIEQWSPLMKLDLTLNNSMLANVEFRRDRNISLGITSKTITEILGRELIIGTGYRFKDLSLGKNFKIAGKPVKSDLNIIGNISVRRNETVIRRIEEQNSQPTAGTKIISLKLSADYAISSKLTIRLFYDRILNRPLISNSFPTSNTNAGISLRLTLSG